MPLFFVLNGIQSPAQINHAMNWVFGEPFARKVHFKDAIPYSTPYTQPGHFSGGASCISDTNGNLRLVCDGYRLWDSVGNSIEGGDTITPKAICDYYFGGSLYAQSSIILPMGEDIFWVLCATVSDSVFNSKWPVSFSDEFDMLTYTVVDMKANGGFGKVLKKAVPIETHGRFSRTQMMACRHADGKSWWLLKQGKDTNRIYKYVLTPDSVYNYGSQLFGAPYSQNADVRGQSAFDAQGKRYASVVINCNQVFMADFDRCNGQLTNPRLLNIPIHPKAPSIPIPDTLTTGVCFSPNDSFLYVVKEFNLYQFDLFDPDTNTAWYHVANMDTTYSQFQMWQTIYMAPNQKLYLGNWNGGSNAFSSIENPNLKGAACQFCPKCLRFPQIGASGIPCMPNYALGKDTTLNCWPMGLNESGIEKREAGECMVYPNPAQTQLTIESEAFKKGLNHLRIFNLMGQCVLEEAFRTASGKHTLSVQGLPSGVYMLKVNNVVRRVVVE